MALRVLLADESSTIKKVFQLALQDYGVDVTAVALGTDVIEVAEKIKPDIIFADVLLQKKSGYDVCREIKSISHLAHIPVVLIWSGFMEFDRQKFAACGANGDLEKPFDTKKLRSVVQQQVPKTKTQPLSNFLTFPKMPDFEEGRPQVELDPHGGVASSPRIPMSPKFEIEPALKAKSDPVDPNAPTGNWNMENFEPLDPFSALKPDQGLPEEHEEFMQVELPTEPLEQQTRTSIENLNETPPLPDIEEMEWVNQSISKYKLAPEKTVEDNPRVKFSVPSEKIDPDTLIGSKPPPIASKPIASKMPSPSHKVTAPMDEDDELLELDLSGEEDVTPLPQKPNIRDTRTIKTPPPAPQVVAAHPQRESVPSTVPPALSEKELVELIKAQSKDMIEKVIWQIVPDLATRIIERELEKLLKERNERD